MIATSIGGAELNNRPNLYLLRLGPSVKDDVLSSGLMIGTAWRALSLVSQLG